MNFASQSNSLIIQHAEDNILSENGLINEGEISTRLGLKGIPSLAEKILVERDLSFLEEYFCRYHIAQISSMKTINTIQRAKNEGKIFTTGVSINNLSLNENDIGDFRTFLKLSPPLRTENDRVSLVEGVKNGIIDVIVSDHKPEDEESKRLTFSQAATGASGIETLLPLVLELYHNQSVPISTLIAAVTSNPSKILGIEKGSLEVGKDADLCIVDINKPWEVKKENLKSKSKNTPIEGRKLQGQVIKTFVKGVLSYNAT
jgi:dihydroorotase